jgi:hypothetical protein
MRISLSIIGEGESSTKLIILMFVYFLPSLGKESIILIGVISGEITIPFFLIS